jgi:hypothetical protein
MKSLKPLTTTKPAPVYICPHCGRYLSLIDDEAGKAAKAPALDQDKMAMLFKFDKDWLARIDAAAKNAELSRLAWVRTIIAKALESEGPAFASTSQ